MKVFLDANVLITVLNKEFPSFPDCARLVSLAVNKKFQLFTSPICLAIAFYFASKKCGERLAKKKIDVLVKHLFISEHHHSAIPKILKNKKIHDVEDGLKYYSAMAANCTCIVTQDKDDFYFSEIEVLTPYDFLITYAV